jgi:hypothetical protein
MHTGHGSTVALIPARWTRVYIGPVITKPQAHILSIPYNVTYGARHLSDDWHYRSLLVGMTLASEEK